MPDTPVTLNGSVLTIADLGKIAKGKHIELEASALTRMRQANDIILKAARDGTPVYGVTTGLGPRVSQALSVDEISEFSYATVRGRAHSIGAPLPRETVRAAMAIRVNSLLCGASGASPEIAQHITRCLNAGLIPHIGEIASTGAADLLWGGSMGLALIGEGRFLGQAEDEPSAIALEKAGITPLQLGPRDGLALASHSSFTSAIAALGHYYATTLLKVAQVASALTLEGFRGNLTPLRSELHSIRPQPGQSEVAENLTTLLEGSTLFEKGNARRLQDPLSIRNIVQVQGSVFAALNSLGETLGGELNGASDNPVVILETQEIISGGNYLNPHLGVTLVGLNHALVHFAAQIYARSSRQLSSRFTDLPNGLLNENANTAGLGPVTKASEALYAEVAYLASPPPVYPSFSADGVEDTITNAAIPAKALNDINQRLASLIAFEMIVATQAIEMRGLEDTIAPALRITIANVRSLSPEILRDRSMTAELEKLAGEILAGNFNVES